MLGKVGTWRRAWRKPQAGDITRLVWGCVVAYLAFTISAVASETLRGDRRYFCQYGTDCRANTWAKRCCREIGHERTGVLRCAAVCD